MTSEALLRLGYLCGLATAAAALRLHDCDDAADVLEDLAVAQGLTPEMIEEGRRVGLLRGGVADSRGGRVR